MDATKISFSSFQILFLMSGKAERKKDNRRQGFFFFMRVSCTT